MGKKGGKGRGGAKVLVGHVNLGQENLQIQKSQDQILKQDNSQQIEKKEEDNKIQIIKTQQKANQQTDLNDCEKQYNKLYKDLELQTAVTFEHNHFELIYFCSADNNLIEKVYNSMSVSNDDSHSSYEYLDKNELLFHLRKITKELEYMFDVPFVKFWVYITKFPFFLNFFDEFLQSARKYNDLNKIKIVLEMSYSSNLNDSVQIEPDTLKLLKKQVNRLLRAIFQIFFRLSQNMESETEYFPQEFYRNLIYDNQIFDVAKLLDIAAIYGSANSAVVKQLISNVLDFDPRFLNDFKEAYDMMLNVFKRIFKDALRTDQMINGDAILQKSRSEQDDVILLLLQDLIEIMTNFQLITSHFGDDILDLVSNTNFMVYITNAYCLAKKIKKLWLAACQTNQAQRSGEAYVENILKLAFQIQFNVIEKGILQKIGQHSKNYAVVQNKLAQTIKQYIMCIIGNVELSKDVLHKQINFIFSEEEDVRSQNQSIYAGKNYSIGFVNHLIKRGLNLKKAIQNFEDRFLPESDKDFLLIVIDSMQNGKKVQIKKVNALHNEIQKKKQGAKDGQTGNNQSGANNSQSNLLSAQDKQNITQIYEMFGFQHSKHLIENVYISNDRSMDTTLELFLTGNIPKEESELHLIIQQEGSKVKQDTTMNQIQQEKKKLDLKNYVLKQYGGILGTDQNENKQLKQNKYYLNHLKALEQQRQEEIEMTEQVKVKIMQQAAIMQYDDDFDEEQIYSSFKKGPQKNKYAVEVVNNSKNQNSQNRENENKKGMDQISSITKRTEEERYSDDDLQIGDNMMDEDEDDLVDELARFVEGQDQEIVKDYSNTFQDDEKIIKIKQQKQESLQQQKPQIIQRKKNEEQNEKDGYDQSRNQNKKDNWFKHKNFEKDSQNKNEKQYDGKGQRNYNNRNEEIPQDKQQNYRGGNQQNRNDNNREFQNRGRGQGRGEGRGYDKGEGRGYGRGEGRGEGRGGYRQKNETGNDSQMHKSYREQDQNTRKDGQSVRGRGQPIYQKKGERNTNTEINDDDDYYTRQEPDLDLFDNFDEEQQTQKRPPTTNQSQRVKAEKDEEQNEDNQNHNQRGRGIGGFRGEYRGGRGGRGNARGGHHNQKDKALRKYGN